MSEQNQAKPKPAPKRKASFKIEEWPKSKTQDHIMEIIASVIDGSKKPMGFGEIFDTAYPKIKEVKSLQSTGEELLRLRAYDKLCRFIKMGALVRLPDKTFQKKKSLVEAIAPTPQI